jgi:predicted acylesterase/phospholipase RssA
MLRILGFTLILFLSGTALVSANANYCRALVLEGDGDKGAFQAGALKAMQELMLAEEV